MISELTGTDLGDLGVKLVLYRHSNGEICGRKRTGNCVAGRVPEKAFSGSHAVCKRQGRGGMWEVGKVGALNWFLVP